MAIPNKYIPSNKSFFRAHSREGDPLQRGYEARQQSTMNAFDAFTHTSQLANTDRRAMFLFE